LDVSNLNNVHEFGQKYLTMNNDYGGINALNVNGGGYGEPLNVLSFNHGLMNTPYHLCTNDGLKSSSGTNVHVESQYQTNHLSAVLLIHYLLPCMLNANNRLEKRILLTGSRMHLR
jgi:hypothetical protein